MTLSPDERRTLFAIARSAIEAALDRRPVELSTEIPPALERPSGVFVTLKLADELRGCIGSVLPVEPLYLAVAHNALNAAFRDPRFPPVTRTEYEKVSLEISVMSLPELVDNHETIEIGKHGLIVRKGHFAGLLLPQVATEYGWGRQEFLGYTCMKAGLSKDAWKDPSCKVEKFTAEVFSETPEGA
jgi:AmmeMemoRadiSam system protein A